MNCFHFCRQKNHEVWNECRTQVLVTGRATSGALAVTAEQRQPLISWRATNSRPGTTSPVQWMSYRFRQLLSELEHNRIAKIQCPGAGVRPGLDLALPVPCRVTLTKFISQSQFSRLLNEENSNLLQVVEN